MKNIMIFSICILIFGCNKSNKKEFTVSGVLKDFDISIATLKTHDSTFIDTIENGLFSFIIPASKEEYIVLEIGEVINLYLKPEDNILIQCNDSNIFNFSGKGFEESQYLYKKKLLIKELGFDDPRMIDIALYSSDPIKFQSKVDSIKQIRINHLNDFKKHTPLLSEMFYETEYQLIRYFWINQLFGYPEFHEMLTQKTPELSVNYYEFTNDIETNRNELFIFNEYISALSSFLNYKSKNFNDKYSIAKELFTNRKMFEEIMFTEFSQYISFNGIDDIDSICLDFINTLSDKEQKEILMDNYQSWSNLAKGKKAPDFSIKDSVGNLVNLSDFIGKYVYIDCWSSYCGPCIAEMPAMKILAEELKDKNIVFVSISADTDTEKWLSKVNEYKMNTINLCTEGAKHQFNIDYNAKAFPRYILIDDKGFIIDANANKPSLIKKDLEQIL